MCLGATPIVLAKREGVIPSSPRISVRCSPGWIGSISGMIGILVVIRDFDVRRALAGPAETHAPLLVDANTVLTFPIAAQGFETVRGRQSKIGQLLRSDQPLKPQSRPALNVGRKAAHEESAKEALRIPVLESVNSKN